MYLWEISARSDHILIPKKQDLYKPTNGEHLWYFSGLNYMPTIYEIEWNGAYPNAPTIKILNAGGAVLEQFTADSECSWADIAASYDDVTGYVTITRSTSIPIKVERYEDGSFNTYATFAAGTDDIQVFLVAGRYRIRRDGTDTECSNTEELNLSKIAIKNSTEGEKLEIGRFGQLQVGKTPDDPDYDPDHDKTYIKFGIVDTPFMVTGSTGQTSISIMVNPDKAPISTVKPFTYFKYSDTEYPNLVKIKNHIYALRPIDGDTVEITPALKESVLNEPVWLVNQFKIYSDLLVAKDKNLAKYLTATYGVEFEFFAGDDYLRFRLQRRDGDHYDMITLDIESDGTVYIELTEPNGTTVKLQPVSFNVGGTWTSTLSIDKPITIGTVETAYQTNPAPPDGTLAVDTNGNLVFRKGGEWKIVQLA